MVRIVNFMEEKSENPDQQSLTLRNRFMVCVLLGVTEGLYLWPLVYLGFLIVKLLPTYYDNLLSIVGLGLAFTSATLLSLVFIGTLAYAIRQAGIEPRTAWCLSQLQFGVKFFILSGGFSVLVSWGLGIFSISTFLITGVIVISITVSISLLILAKDLVAKK